MARVQRALTLCQWQKLLIPHSTHPQEAKTGLRRLLHSAVQARAILSELPPRDGAGERCHIY